MAKSARNKDPGNVIFVKTSSINSEVATPGLTLGIKPPFLLKSSAIVFGLTVSSIEISEKNNH